MFFHNCLLSPEREDLIFATCVFVSLLEIQKILVLIKESSIKEVMMLICLKGIKSLPQTHIVKSLYLCILMV